MSAHLCIIGVGLIGGSLGLALRQGVGKSGFCHEIIGWGRHPENLKAAVECGAVDRYEVDIAKAVSVADIIFIATPLATFKTIFSLIQPHVKVDTVITDAGSAKACVIRDAESCFGKVPTHLVPGHPIAGNEKSGVGAAFPELYRDRRVILTPVASTQRQAIDIVRQMWESAGAKVEEMDIHHHDDILAATSHLPHMLAFGLVDSLARNGDVDEIFRYAAGGFRDFTRIASSDPVMWRDICVHNREAILKALHRYRKDLEELNEAIKNTDAETLQTIFSRAKAARDKFCF